ncbi:hypothetical protein BDV96DRAFT_56885 [Lophiotrema nucula]|uniref:Uncharacterized protein n=1 Tax=Lophiotrema nucula TaxID=690887 RepID=A0A6A5Z8F7_9PLEO|nr:hypothetical protein BDV96DRAFT_56885 [Lophiotrema nucula]
MDAGAVTMPLSRVSTRRIRRHVRSWRDEVDVTSTPAVASGERCRRGWTRRRRPGAYRDASDLQPVCSSRWLLCRVPGTNTPASGPPVSPRKPRASHPRTISASRTGAAGRRPALGGVVVLQSGRTCAGVRVGGVQTASASPGKCNYSDAAGSIAPRPKGVACCTFKLA